jgi:hypothetical protein
MRYFFLLGFLLLWAAPVSAQVFPVTTTFTVSEWDDDLGVFLKTLSGAPEFTVYGVGPNNSDPFSLGTLKSGTGSLHFKGPYEKLIITMTGGTGHGEISWLGRVAP